MNDYPLCHPPDEEEPRDEEMQSRDPAGVSNRRLRPDGPKGPPTLQYMEAQVPPGGFDDHRPACQRGVDEAFVGWYFPRIMSLERVRLMLLWGLWSRDPYGGTLPPRWVYGLEDDGTPTDIGPDLCSVAAYYRKGRPWIQFP